MAALGAAVDSVLRIRPHPDAVLVTGDLTESAAEEDYDRVCSLLQAIGSPLYVLPGNHDDRAALRRHFGVPGEGDEPVQYSADLGPLRLVVADTTTPGEDPGVLDAERLAWLDAELAAERDAPTVLAMHHPPLVTGIPPLDAIGLPASDRRALAEVLEGHPQVRRIVAGHMHRAIFSELAGRVVVAAPSTYMQAVLDLEDGQLRLEAGPAGYAVHALLDGELVSHVEPVG